LQAERSEPEWLKHLGHAEALVSKEQYSEAKKEYAKSWKVLPKEMTTKEPDRARLISGFYNYSCVLAVEAKSLSDGEARRTLLEEAIRWLTNACDHGFLRFPDSGKCHPTSAEHMRTDVDLELLVPDLRFMKLLGYSRE
jgi:hypothetical protein